MVVDLVRGFVLDRMNTSHQHHDSICGGEHNNTTADEDVEDIDVIREQLENSTDINEQADILQFLYKTRYSSNSIKSGIVKKNQTNGFTYQMRHLSGVFLIKLIMENFKD